jgi:hypothetical protein
MMQCRGQSSTRLGCFFSLNIHKEVWYCRLGSQQRKTCATHRRRMWGPNCPDCIICWYLPRCVRFQRNINKHCDPTCRMIPICSRISTKTLQMQRMRSLKLWSRQKIENTTRRSSALMRSVMLPPSTWEGWWKQSDWGTPRPWTHVYKTITILSTGYLESEIGPTTLLPLTKRKSNSCAKKTRPWRQKGVRAKRTLP